MDPQDIPKKILIIDPGLPQTVQLFAEKEPVQPGALECWDTFGASLSRKYVRTPPVWQEFCQ